MQTTYVRVKTMRLNALIDLDPWMLGSEDLPKHMRAFISQYLMSTAQLDRWDGTHFPNTTVTQCGVLF